MRRVLRIHPRGHAESVEGACACVQLQLTNSTAGQERSNVIVAGNLGDCTTLRRKSPVPGRGAFFFFFLFSYFHEGREDR